MRHGKKLTNLRYTLYRRHNYIGQERPVTSRYAAVDTVGLEINFNKLIAIDYKTYFFTMKW